MISPASPIGIFDSGVGGLSVLREVTRLLPHESVIYFADTAHVPYGDKPLPVVRELALQLTRALAEQEAKLVLIASGTSTVAGLTAAQAEFPDLPLLGTIMSGARAAASIPGAIGVLATAATVHSLAFTRAICSLDPNRTVFEKGCPLFVPLVESGKCDTEEAACAAKEYLPPLLRKGAQSIILGCTHFPFLLPALADAIPPELRKPVFVDPARECVLEAKGILAQRDLLAGPESAPRVKFYATGDVEDFRLQASRLLGCPIKSVEHLDLHL